MESADFDNDGYDDFLIAEAWANIHFFKNLYTTFKIEYSGSNIGSCFKTVANDLNDDDKIDVVAASFNGNIYAYENLGDFNFSEKKSPLFVSAKNYGCAIGDFDGDGIDDIAYGEDPVKIAFNVIDIFGLTNHDETDVNEIKKSLNNIRIYPNPTEEYLNIEFNKEPQNYFIELYNNIGQCVIQQKSKNKKVQIDLNEFTHGIYFLKIFNNEFNKTEKIIVN